MKPWFNKNLKIIKTIIKILLAVLIIGWIFGMFANYGVDDNLAEKIGQWHNDISIENEKIVKDDISISYYWENGSKVMKEGRYYPQTKLFKDLLSFQDGFAFAFAVVSITNNGEKDESINLRDFKTRDSNGIVMDSAYFSSYPTLDKIEYIIDKQKEKIDAFSGIEDLNITLPPKSTKKISILFKFPIDSKSAGLSVSYK